MPFYARHPVVVDANVLFQDTQRYLHTGFTALTFLAQHDVITLLTSEHVRSRLPEIIAAKGRRPGAQHRTWLRSYLPLVRFVNVPTSMCAGHPQIEAMADQEDLPFARLAIATAPSLLLTRDHHFTDVGMGTEDWADTLVVLGSLVELDMMVYGTSHAAVVLARVLGILARRLWQSVSSEPLPWLAAAAAAALLVLVSDWNGAVHRLRAIAASARRGGSRLLELSEPAFEQRQRAEGEIASRLEAPMLPRSVECACARELATRRERVTTGALLGACVAAGHAPTATQFTHFLTDHVSFVSVAPDEWEFGSLGLAIVDCT